MESLLKKLSYFNLGACLVYLALAKDKSDWLSFVLLLFPLVFNWRVMQNLKLEQFKIGFWHYLTAVMTLLYAMLEIAYAAMVPLGIERPILIFLVAKVIFALSLILHFILSLKLNKQYQTNKN